MTRKSAPSAGIDDSAYRGLIEAVTDVAIYRLAPDGLVESWNPGARRLKGYQANEIVGRHFSCFYAAEDRENSLPRHALEIAAREGVFENEGWRLRKDGSRFWAHVVIDPIRDETGALLGFAKVTHDVTKNHEQREHDKLLAARTLEAEAATRAKSRFLANMGHEIRSPMNAILGMLQVLMQTDLSVTQTDYATKAYSATETLLRLFNDILDFSEMEAERLILEPAPFSLDALMCDLRALTAPTVGDKPLTLEFSIEPGLKDEVMGDMFRLRQVLLNLIGNAVKFTPRGKVLVSLRRPSGERRRSIVEFAIQDSGIGIEPDKLAAVFEGFQQADASTTRTYGGPGLGLTISQKLVSLMGGRLEVESAPDKGSRFSFILSLPPTSQGTALHTVPKPPARVVTPNSKPLTGLKLLAVDDLPLNLEVARHLLTAAGAEVIVADSGASALDLALAADPPFDVILMDLQMPGMDGLEATRRLRCLPKTEATPIIAVTANAAESDRQDCLAAGMNDHLPKPFNIADLIPVILSHRSGPKKPAALIDADLALQRLAGDMPLFAKIARQFVRDSGVIPDQVADALAREAPAEGAALLHKLKSQAATMGAQRLAGMAAGLEAELKAGSLVIDVASLRRLLADTNWELAFVIDTLTPVADPNARATVPLTDQLAELDGLLEAGNMRALEICAAIEETRRGMTNDPFAAVSQAVDKLDFATARQALAAMDAAVVSKPIAR